MSDDPHDNDMIARATIPANDHAEKTRNLITPLAFGKGFRYGVGSSQSVKAIP
jgi:hypothetical protein